MSPASRCCRRLLTVLNPPGEPEPIGYRALAPVDRFLRDAPHPGHRRNARRRRSWIAAALFPHVRLRSHPLAQPEDRIDFDLARTWRRPACRRQCGQRGRAVARRGRAAAEKLQKLPEVFAGDDAAEFRAAGSGQETGDDPGIRPAAWARRCSGRHRASRRPTRKTSRRSTAWPTNSTRSQAMPQGPGADAARRLAANAVKLAQADEARARHARRRRSSCRCETALGQLRGFLQRSARSPKTTCRRLSSAMDDAGRARARRDRAQGRYQRHRGFAHIRARDSRRLSERHRRPDFDSRIRATPSSGHSSRRASTR